MRMSVSHFHTHAHRRSSRASLFEAEYMLDRLSHQFVSHLCPNQKSWTHIILCLERVNLSGDIIRVCYLFLPN
jgi:hypothetical protein